MNAGDSPHRIHVESHYAKLIAACSENDFDGHTDFENLTPEQRLEWLAAAVRFVHELRSGYDDPGMKVSRLDLP
jgi:hypothetical protein